MIILSVYFKFNVRWIVVATSIIREPSPPPVAVFVMEIELSLIKLLLVTKMTELKSFCHFTKSKEQMSGE